MRINTNMGALMSLGNLTTSDANLSKSIERLASGLRINRAADDAAGMSIAENLRAQFKGMGQAIKNANDGISLVQAAEGGLTEVSGMLQRMRELAVQSATGHFAPEDRMSIQSEVDSLASEITRTVNSSQFNSKELLTGALRTSGLGDLLLQVGANAGETLSLGISAMDATTLGVSRDSLTGIIDNGTPYALNTTALNIDILDGGSGLVSGAYKVRFDDSTPPAQIWLEDNAGVPIGPAVTYTPNTASPGLTIGDASTGRTLTLATGTLPVGNLTANLTASFPNAVTRIGTVGAGVTAGTYTVSFTPPLMQLQDSLGNNIGSPVAPSPGTTVTLGDATTARTVNVTIKAPLPTSATIDTLRLGTAVGKVSNKQGDLAGSIVTDTGGVVSVGTGLATGTYGIQLGAGVPSLQLVNASNSPIGTNMIVNGNGTITIGDVATNRTITITPGAMPPPPGFVSVDVTNNQGIAQSAVFSNGVKISDAQTAGGINVSTQNAASQAISTIERAIAMVTAQRTELGAVQNRLEHAQANLQVGSENMLASESRIRDVDMAQETTTMAKHQILLQSSLAILGQANARPQSVLSLIRPGGQ